MGAGWLTKSLLSMIRFDSSCLGASCLDPLTFTDFLQKSCRRKGRLAKSPQLTPLPLSRLQPDIIAAHRLFTTFSPGRL
ncbi:hypothetical protein BD289DRAFT_174331 [Coniella lustricola]|uniref:Uncharacterized protein n=1 Tax=Coniella lustricola TaxID=2025994 RepID=A0A2T3ADT4_9PEZI|nr:hypothetical protein BD289DRAFT_174331 [Coniella lustricola]